MAGNDRKGRIRVEIVFATAEQQSLKSLQVAPGSTVQQVIDASGMARDFPAFELGALDVGIWGRSVARDTIVSDGDRVEIYRPLVMDPREARRLRAGPHR